MALIATALTALTSLAAANPSWAGTGYPPVRTIALLPRYPKPNPNLTPSVMPSSQLA